MCESKQLSFQSSFKSARVLAVILFTVSWFQTVGIAPESRCEMRLKWAHMVDVEDKLWMNIMSWWADVPVKDHVGMPVDRGFLLRK